MKNTLLSSSDRVSDELLKGQDFFFFLPPSPPLFLASAEVRRLGVLGMY